MRDKENWKPSKFVYKRGTLRASRNPQEVGIGSRILADIIAEFYGQQLKLHAKGKLLDLGCGKAPLYHSYKDHVSENICVDWGESLHKNPYLDMETDLNQKLPFDESEFDTIILSDVLEHIRRPEQLLEETYRILSKGGKMLINVPFYYWLHEEPHDYFRYTEFALKAFAEDAGFNIIMIEPRGGVPEILGDITAKMLKKTPIIGKLLASSIEIIVRLFVSTGIGRKMSKLSAVKFPLAYFMIVEKPL